MRLCFETKDKSIIYFDVTLSRRKSIVIIIDTYLNIKVKAPYRTSKDIIISIVKSKSDWILRKLDEAKENQNFKLMRNYKDGESLWFSGKEYFLKIDTSSDREFICLDDDHIVVYTENIETAHVKELLYKWYREKAETKVSERVEVLSHLFSRKPAKVKVKEQKRRWGSCTSRGDIYINWRLVMAPVDVLDYVLVHEMCHLTYMNHSKDFYNLVESLMPDFRLKRKYLKENGMKLNI